MGDNYHLYLLGLIILSSLLTGVSGVDDVHVFISSGEDVRLPCNNALQDCKSTVWNYNRFRDSAAVELIRLGIKKKDTERHERLSLGFRCSLNIRNISTQDYGSYICQQWTGEGGERLRPDAGVYLHVLHVSSSQTEISAGLSVTLFCQLYSSDRVSCDDWIRSERIHLFWVNQAGVKLTRSDSRYQVSSSSDHCIISLTTTLLNEDHNREWRCEVTHRDQVKTSVTYTVKSSGVSGVDDVHVFISSGEDVTLSCNNALQDCNSTTWIYNRFRDSAAVELIGLGIKKDIERHERLSLGSDCSLNIRNISTQDYGSYICRQYVNHTQLRPDAGVYLHVLRVSSSQTEISAGLSVTLFCQLHSYPRVSCDDWIRSERIHLFWVNQAGVKANSRYQISSSSGHCIISLNTTLLNEDHNREWRCEVTHRDQVKTSVTYTVESSARADTKTEPSYTKVAVISVSVAAIAILLAAVLWLIWRKRADSDRGTGEAVVKDENDDKKTYETINMDTPAAAREHERTDDVTYSEVSSTSKKPVKSLKDHNDTVTYATIR